MRRIPRPLPRIVLALWLCAASATAAVACTGIRLQAADGAVVYARTMEFGMDLHARVLMLPRGYEFQGTAPGGKPGLAWRGKYAALGMNALGEKVLVDGVNEQGLAGGIFYFPGYAQFQEVSPGEESHTLASWELLTWVLTNFATVQEVRAALPTVCVGRAVHPGWTDAPPGHYIVHDRQGQSLVIEYTDGKLHVYDNPLGVITNAPDFAWHTTNLNNYLGLKPTDAAAKTLDGLKLSPFGQGSGLVGLPGDFTPPARLVRAAVFSQSVEPGKTGEEAIGQAFHVLDQFDIPRGVVRGENDNPATYEITQWTAGCDLASCRYYFHTYDNRRIRRVELLKLDLEATEAIEIPLGNGQDVQDLTPDGGGIVVSD